MTLALMLKQPRHMELQTHRRLYSLVCLTDIMRTPTPLALAHNSIPNNITKTRKAPTGLSQLNISNAAEIILEELSRLSIKGYRQRTTIIDDIIYSLEAISAFLKLPVTALTLEDLKSAVSSVVKDMRGAGLLDQESIGSGNTERLRKQLCNASQSSEIDDEFGFDDEFFNVMSSLAPPGTSRRGIMDLASAILGIVGDKYGDKNLVRDAYKRLRSRVSQCELMKCLGDSKMIDPAKERQLIENLFGSQSAFESILKDLKRRFTSHHSQLAAKFSGLGLISGDPMSSSKLFKTLGHCRGLITAAQQLDSECVKADMLLVNMAKYCSNLSLISGDNTFDQESNYIRLTCSPNMILAHFTRLWRRMEANAVLWKSLTEVLDNGTSCLKTLLTSVSNNETAKVNLTQLFKRINARLNGAKQRANLLEECTRQVQHGMDMLQRSHIPFCTATSSLLVLTDEIKRKDVSTFIKRFDSIGWKKVLNNLRTIQRIERLEFVKDEVLFTKAANSMLKPSQSPERPAVSPSIPVIPSLCLTLGDEFELDGDRVSVVERINEIMKGYESSSSKELLRDALIAYAKHYKKYQSDKMTEAYLKRYRPIHSIDVERLEVAHQQLSADLEKSISTADCLTKLRQHVDKVIDPSYYVAPIGGKTQQATSAELNRIKSLLKKFKAVLFPDNSDDSSYQKMRQTGWNQLRIILQLIYGDSNAPSEYEKEGTKILTALNHLNRPQRNVCGLLSAQSITTTADPTTCAFNKAVSEENTGTVKHISTSCENCSALTLNTCGWTANDAVALRQKILENVSGPTEDRVKVMALYLERHLKGADNISGIDLESFRTLVNACSHLPDSSRAK